MTTDVKMDNATVSQLMDLTRQWTNASLMNDGLSQLSARQAMSKVLQKFDADNDTSEFSIDVKTAKRCNTAPEYMMERMQYLQQRCA